jgi:predicted aconitase
VALFHVEGITPEARIFTYDTRGLESVPVEWNDILDVFSDAPVDAVALGCPHCSEQELARIAALLEGKTVRIPLYVFAAHGVMEKQKPLVEAIEKSGARVFADTCMVVSPAMERFGTIMVNSGKAFSYVPNMCGAAVRLGTTVECIQVATGAPGKEKAG